MAWNDESPFFLNLLSSFQYPGLSYDYAGGFSERPNDHGTLGFFCPFLVAGLGNRFVRPRLSFFFF